MNVTFLMVGFACGAILSGAVALIYIYRLLKGMWR